MGLFSKLFGDTSNEQFKQKNTIFDFFKTDLKSVPNDSFIKGELEVNTNGKTVQNYRKNLEEKECGIFEILEVRVIDNKDVNVSFITLEPNKIKTSNLKTLIDEFYLIYGKDSDDKGKYTNEDESKFFDSSFCMLFGRMWVDNAKYQYNVHLSRDEEEFSLNIWSVNK